MAVRPPVNWSTNCMEGDMENCIRTQLGFDIDDSKNPTGGTTLPGTFKERFHAIARAISRCDYRGRIYDGVNPQGLRIFLIGEMDWSRAIAVHPEDPAGIVYLLVDDGKEINMTKPVVVAQPIWLGELITSGYVSVYDALEAESHNNPRLRNARAL